MTSEEARPTGEEVNTIHRLLVDNLGRTHTHLATVLADWHAERVAQAKAEAWQQGAQWALRDQGHTVDAFLSEAVARHNPHSCSRPAAPSEDCTCEHPYIGTQAADEPVRCETCRGLVSRFRSAAPSEGSGPWTRHGHPVAGVTVDGPGRPPTARCGGPALCGQCAIDAARLQAADPSEGESDE